MGRLRPQLTEEINVLMFTDGGNRSVGVKRQILLESATSDWISFIDDDDLIPGDYCQRIAEIIFGADPPDVVGFRLNYFLDGHWLSDVVHSYDHKKIPRPSNVTVDQTRLDRNPNHLNPVRRELALRVGYKDLDQGEDGDYSIRLSRLVPRPKETFIDRVMYDYFKPSSRPGDVTHETRLISGARR